jgi:hypothetical protein
MADKTQEVEKLEKEIIHEEGEIKRVEKRIDDKEQKILAEEGKILKKTSGLNIFGGNFQAKVLHSRFVQRLSKHKILYSFITLVSIILIWSGIQEFLKTVPVIGNPIVSIVLGVVIVWVIDRELT